MSQQAATLPGTTPPGAHRKTFNDEFQQQSIEIGERLLALVPELEGVAIIPSWTVPQEHLATGIVIGRDGPLRTPGQNMHMAQQLHAALRQQLDNIVRVMAGLNGEAGRLRQELNGLDASIKQRQQQLDELNSATTAARRATGERD